MELVKNIEDLMLELPTGRVQASQSLWKVPPYSTKTIMNAHFKASSISNYTGYIRCAFLIITWYYSCFGVVLKVLFNFLLDASAE